MTAITIENVRDLHTANFSDLPVIALDTDGQIEIFPATTATERNATVLTDASILNEWLDGNDLDDQAAAQFAAEVNDMNGLTEDFDHEDGYVAAIAITPDVVEGDNTDVSVIERVVTGYTDGENGTEVPEYGAGDKVVHHAETDVPTAADDASSRSMAAADELLEDAGWTRTGAWEASDNAIYAPVTRS